LISKFGSPAVMTQMVTPDSLTCGLRVSGSVFGSIAEISLRSYSERLVGMWFRLPKGA